MLGCNGCGIDNDKEFEGKEEDDKGIFILAPFAILLVSINRILIISFPKSIFSLLYFFWVTFNSNTSFVSVERFGAIK